jgi:peptidoglycan-associated lipoprotein
MINMMRKTRLPLAALVLACSVGLTNCDDDEAPEEPIAPVAEELPAPPPSEPSVGQSEATKNVYFAFDDYTLSPESQESLNQLSDFMKGTPSVVVQIEGHCDERGSTEYNLALGERRAQSVKNYLVQLGIDPARLPTMSWGEEKPSAQGSNESSWSQNRRAVFTVSQP